MPKGIIICGATASGKTKFALDLAKKIRGQIISADSRQVYLGLDLLTGKDLPNTATGRVVYLDNFKKPITYYRINGVKLWGYDLISPGEEYSTAHFYRFGFHLLESFESVDSLPIIVGGAGNYIEALVDPPQSLLVKPDPHLRNLLENLSLGQLQIRLQQVNQVKFDQLNQSDKNNPRRLIRAIEVAQCSLDTIPNKPDYDWLWLGLRQKKDEMRIKIEANIDSRITPKLDKEVSHLMKLKEASQLGFFSCLGFEEWSNYLKGQITKTNARQQWISQELAYAKRQLTWFKSKPQINWFDTSSLPVQFPSILQMVDDFVHNQS